MPDPLSIAAFGITVCQGLHFTLNAWIHFNSDVLRAIEQIRSLTNILTFLKSILEASADSVGTDTSHVQACVIDCHAGLEDLQRQLNKLQPSQSSSSPLQIKGPKVQKFLYPLTKQRLKKLQDSVIELQDRLNLALQVYQLYLSSFIVAVFVGYLLILYIGQTRSSTKVT